MSFRLPRITLPALVALVALAAAAVPRTAAAVPAQGLEWRWEEGQPRRWYVSTEVTLPGVLWVTAEKVTEARLLAYGVEMIIACQEPVAAGKRSWDLTCDIEEISLQGAALSGDRGLLQPILEEADERLTGAQLQVRLRKDGRVVNFDLEGVTKHNRRTSTMHDTLRIMLARAVAGFDLQLPRKGYTTEGIWAQYQSTLLSAPSNQGSAGSAEIAHLIRSVDGDLVIVETAGKALIVPATDGMGQNFYKTELESIAVFDTGSGSLRERVWSAVGEPTASSVSAEGGEGVFYGQKGKILMIVEGIQAPVLRETKELEPPDTSSTAIESWSPLQGQR